MLDTPIVKTLKPLISKAHATKERQPFYIVVDDTGRTVVKKYYVVPYSLVVGKYITDVFHADPPGDYTHEWDTVTYDFPTFVNYWDAYTFSKTGKTLKEISNEPTSNPDNTPAVEEGQSHR